MKQEIQKEHVSMKVNQKNLVKGLKYSFTNKTTVLGELMQNARRAGASKVVFNYYPETRTLRVCDDGQGIDSIETLLTVAESGWDENTVSQEHPCGIGFLSALFACRHLTVTSKSGSISANTDDILSFNSVTITKTSDWDGFTTIAMKDVDLEEKVIESTLKHLARGFPIPVVFNNEPLKRPLAIGSELNFVDTEIGSIYLHGLDTPSTSDSHFELFLQGLPIYRSRKYFSSANEHIIHLDSSSFYARLPDREKLINQEDALVLIKNALAKEIEKRLVFMKSTLSAEVFVSFYSVMRDWKLLSLLNDVPLVPVQVLSEVIDYPVCNTDAFDSFESNFNLQTPLSRNEIEARGVVSINDDIQDEGSARYLFVWKKNYLIYHGNLDSGHWLHALVRQLGIATIEIVNESHRSVFRGGWAWISACFCDAYKIHINDETVEISDMAMYTGQREDDLAIIPKGDDSSDVLKQAYSFKTEYDDFQETSWESDSEAFLSFVVANTSKAPADAMKRLLPNFSGCPALFGGQFILTLDEAGKIKAVIST